MAALSLIFAAATLFAPGQVRAQALGSTVIVPLTIDYVTLSEALQHQMYTEHGRASLWNGSDQCQYLYAENPVFSREGERVKLETNGTLSLGVAVGSQCLSPIVWNGIIEAEAAPYIGPHLMLKFRVTDLNLYDPRHEKTLIAGKGFDLIKQYFIPRLETFTFDLEPATRQLENLAEAAATPEVAERIKAALATLRAEPQLAVLDDGVRARLAVTLPALPAASAAPAPAQLTPAELAAFEKLLDQWDAFLVFSIKQLGGTSSDPLFRDDLLSLLLESRYRLVDALVHPESGGPDPVRLLFLKEWQRLGDIIRSAARRGRLGDHSLEFLSFISAGDALFAFDEAAPALGMRISADDLRRLAHIMAPRVTTDPLAFSFDEDPALRAMFGIRAPLEMPDALETTATETPTPMPTSSPNAAATPAALSSPTAAPAVSPAASPPPSVQTPAVTTPSPHVTPNPASAPISDRNGQGKSHISISHFPLSWIEPAEVYAAETAGTEGDPVLELQKLGKKLKRAVVLDDNVDEYDADMERLLELTGGREIGQEDIGQQYRAIFLRLAKTTAWQESCWRQFVLRRNRVVYLESSTGDIGLMQVNKYVWRGFYRLPRLEWDVLYNADAGIQILARLLRDVAGKNGAATPGRSDELARSVYAAYNGGPGAYHRWRGPEARGTRLIDEAFWAKYQAIVRGQHVDVLACAAKWSKSAGN